ncbi:hypothetical protein GGR57DRAFT_410455 [Xylariaceae sp. FL1272]|nr:hypothetical protein GGR57DRAFT_410455 [Xylariaceae sp. FL1272]
MVSLIPLLGFVAGLMVALAMPTTGTEGISIPTAHTPAASSETILKDVLDRSTHLVLPIITDLVHLPTGEPSNTISDIATPTISYTNTHPTINSLREDAGESGITTEESAKERNQSLGLTVIIIMNCLLLSAAAAAFFLYLWRDRKDTGDTDSHGHPEEGSPAEEGTELNVIHARSAPNWPLTNPTSPVELVIDHCRGHPDDRHDPSPLHHRND